jgi:hypothetical protein
MPMWRREHHIWMQWLPKISNVNAGDRDRPISPNIFADVGLADRYCKDTVLDFCDWIGALGGYTATDRLREIRNKFGQGGKVDVERIMAVLLTLFFSRLRKILLCHDGNSMACTSETGPVCLAHLVCFV